MFDSFLNDKIRVINSQGDIVVDEIKAHVQPDKIDIHNGKINIKEGDYIERLLPNGNTEKYLVLDAAYHASFHAIPERYECIVEKVTSLPKKNSNTVYHFNGNNSRVYNNSIDNSNNILNFSNEELFKNLQEVIIR